MVCISEGMERLISRKDIKILGTETQRESLALLKKMINRLKTKDYRLKTNLSSTPRNLETLERGDGEGDIL